MTKKQQIKCDVETCKFQNCENELCELDEIKVSSSCEKESPIKDKKGTACASFEYDQCKNNEES